MTESNSAFSEQLKQILKNVRSPERLDDHPWTHSLFVQDALRCVPQLQGASPGAQLVGAIAALFRQMQPPVLPRHGKRLDPRWGEFGLLAALYFAPFENGRAFPTSLLDAWGRIDPAILHFVYGKPPEALEEGERRPYQLVGADVEYGAASTLSDWHKKGVQRLAEILLNQERFLSRTSALPSGILGGNGRNGAIAAQPQEAVEMPLPRAGRLRMSRRAVWVSLACFLIAALGLAGYQGWRIYRSGLLVYQDLTELRGLAHGPVEIDTADQVLPLLEQLKSDLTTFRKEAGPVLWVAPRLGWVPVYGQDLAAAPGLMELAGHLTDTVIISAETGGPLLQQLNAQGSSLAPAELTALLLAAQPGLREARNELDEALAAREMIAANGLSPRLQSLVVDELDPVLTQADDGLSLALTLPGLVGAGSDGPKTYLLLVQNEDELRPTGGFITAIGNLVVHNGQIISLGFEEAGELEDWTKPYPVAPWQLREYMNSPVLVLRDSNWYPDFPTAAQWAEYLYAYTHDHSVDGVIAFDQHLLVMLLGEMGSLEVEGVPYPITGQNVIEYMRQAKEPPQGAPTPQGWYRKEFIARLAGAVLDRLMSGDQEDWRGVTQVLGQALAERHLLLQFDDPAATASLARRGWDHAVHPDQGDFLLVTDSNIGFNKTNAVVEVSLAYDVDLTDLAAPEGTLAVTHANQARKDVPCIHWNTGEITEEASYPINRCYWNYLRVYKQPGVDLLEASPHEIPGEWMILGDTVPARVDDLEEELDGIRGFGTLLEVPGGESLSTDFRFALPEGVLVSREASGGKELVYRLTVRKQPGTLAIPLVVRIHLPNGAVLISSSRQAVQQGNHLLIEADLRTDFQLELVFRQPQRLSE